MTTPAPSSAQIIAQDLAAAGYTSPQVAGVLGNLQVESGLRADAINPREGAHGFAQWENGRWSGPNGLAAFAAAHGTSWDDPNTQAAFLVSELQGPEHAAGAALAQATTPTQAATVFDQLYERSSPASLPARIAAANTFAAGGVAGGSGAPTSGGGGAGYGVQTVGLGSDIAGGILGGLGTALRPLGRFVVDAGLVILGAVAIIAGVMILARSGSDQHDDGAPVVVDGHGKGVEADAADAAEVAA